MLYNAYPYACVCDLLQISSIQIITCLRTRTYMRARVRACARVRAHICARAGVCACTPCVPSVHACRMCLHAVCACVLCVPGCRVCLCVVCAGMLCVLACRVCLRAKRARAPPCVSALTYRNSCFDKFSQSRSTMCYTVRFFGERCA